ncbi:hypothetical protein C2S53_015351 [Perilla frutescens var. hirtella]|uniref:Uncharacterized protein n=1 Tax=Perilla frutescens var. hirtella TaxID=608512 RepID=A0AAD4JB72_PERFH|nr:hypothetical protein C2S53_015351 [Perilla frutescens var. hirtella]
MACRCLVMSVVIILLALDYSSAKCDQGMNLGTETDQKDVFLQSDTKFLFGRKMLLGIDGKPVYTPGKNKPTDLENPFPEAQTENNRIQAQQHSQKSMSNVAKRDHTITKKHDESKAFEEAADEVANLMRKDYKGMARRKPPINNHEPKD